MNGIVKAAPDAARLCGKVAVLMGGTSAEREVSLKSGNAVLEALLESGVDAFPVDLQQAPVEQLLALRVDRVFNILHGGIGEGGGIQALLEMLNLPYTGSGVCASALTLDKLLTKKILLASGIPTPDFLELETESDCQQLLDEVGLAVFVKPVMEGSSIGMTPVHVAGDLLPAWHKARQYGRVFAEKFISGTEYTAGFLGSQVLPLIKLGTPREFYDYEAKYVASDTEYTCPSGLDQESVTKINEMVEQTMRVTGVRNWGRIDLMMDEKSQPWIIEVNTAPGMTDHSLVPMAAREAGLDMPALVLRILELTLKGNG